MNQFLNWWKVEKRYMTMLKAVLMAALPLVCCLVYCAMQGQSLGNVYLPESEWNDELFYFKQVEGIVTFGYPQGYFGFNESHALRLSFAAWSPVLVFPWILWGKLFGWTILSPMYCNIVLLMLTMFGFVWLTKPTWKQVGILAFLVCFFPLYVRYMLSGMPEIICFCMMITFYGLVINYEENEKAYKLALLFLMAAIMTLMRPYLLLTMLLPIFFWVRKNRKWGWIGAAGILAMTLAGYWLIKHFLGAEYFAPLFFTDWITVFFREGIGAGIHNFFGTLYYMGTDVWRYMIEAFRSGNATGAHFFGFLLMGATLFYQGIRDWRKKRYKECIPELHLALSFVAMFFAVLLMYKLNEGSKHLLTFVATGIFLVSRMETRTFKKAIYLAAAFVYLYTYQGAAHPYDYQVPFATEEERVLGEAWKNAMQANMPLKEDATPNYENVVIWTLSDQIGEKEVYSEWQVLYELPAGFGVSCCQPEYVQENLETLQSRFLLTVSGGAIDEACGDKGYQEIFRDSEAVLYQRY